MNITSLRLCTLLILASTTAFAQKKPLPVCSQTTFASFKPLPKLEYQCPEGLADYDDQILKLPTQIAAINGVAKSLQSFTNAKWWQANVDDLNSCEIHGSAGALTDEEGEKWRQGGYQFSLLGNHDLRLMLLSDPCYQTGFGGANAFLLYRQSGRVFVTQLLNGYYSRR